MSSPFPAQEAQVTFTSRYQRKRTTSLVTVSSGLSKGSLQPQAVERSVPVHTSSHLVYGSFTPTASAQASLSHIRRLSLTGKQLHVSPLAKHVRPWHDEDADSPLSSGPPSPVIPSIMRTTSASMVEGDLPSPLLPSVSYLHQNFVTPPRKGKEKEEMNPILARLERKSRLLSQKAQCATCGKSGADFPKCGRCNMMWCSRDCRMSGGKRHVCKPRQ